MHRTADRQALPAVLALGLAAALAAVATPAVWAGAAAPDRIWVKGTEKPLQGFIESETMKDIKLQGGLGVNPVTVVRIIYGDAPTAFNLGNDNRKQGIFSEAIKYYETAMTIPNVRKFWIEPTCRYYIAMCYLEEGSDMVKAEARFKELLAQHKDTRFWPDAVLGLGRAQLLAGKPDAALVQFDRLAKAAAGAAGWDEWLFTAYLWQSRAYIEQQKYTEALQAASKVVGGARDEKFADLVIQAKSIQAKVYLQQGKADEAVALLGDLIRAIGPHVAAEIDAGGETRMQRTEAQCYNALGQAYLKRYAKSKSDEDLRRALLGFLWTVVLYPRPAFAEEHAEALYYGATCFERLKQGSRATELRNELSEKYPESPFKKMLTPGKATTPRKETEK